MNWKQSQFTWQRHFSLLGLLVLWGMCCGSPVLAQAARPIAYWGFGQEESTPLESHGGVHRDVPGPRPDVYPDFTPDNTAVRLDGKGARFTFDDPGENSPFDFTNGDAITLEAWVRITQINEGDNVYIVGKGRTGNPRFAKDNQNWALRLRRLDGRINISFLFSSVLPNQARPQGESNWHRWTSDRGFKQGDEWHHVAIAYRFGEPESIVGVIDGTEVSGQWDAGGPTRNPPTVDNDAIWIGSALGGSPSNSLRGDLDEVAIYRTAVPAETLKSRYRGPQQSLTVLPLPEEMPDLGSLAPGVVQVTLHEGMPTHFRWLNEGESVSEPRVSWQTESFLLDGVPQKYDDWGIRESWNGPVLVRMAADVSLTPGTHRFLMRVRGLSRLWVNGQLVARGKPMVGSQNGFEPITPPTPAPKPGLRIARHRQQEVFGEARIESAEKTRIVLEMIVGGRDFRVDPGEACVAIETADGAAFQLLHPAGGQLLLTDPIVTSLLATGQQEMMILNDQRRRLAALSQNSFWDKRHQIARDWVKQHPAPAVPAHTNAQHPIDTFLAVKIQLALEATAQTPPDEVQLFHRNVLPILRDHCFRCHGDKVQGGLRLDTAEAAKKGGDSGLPAIHARSLEESELIRRVRSTSPEERMPPGGDGLTAAQIAILEDWIGRGAPWPAVPVSAEMVELSPLSDDATFLRRVYLDTVGVIPTAREARDFQRESSPEKRLHVIDRLLADDRWADHWTGYWLDVLAENPTLINASLNTTGPFRWFVYDSLRDNKPFDRFVTELILMRGSAHEGGSAGFGIAANNDSPLAAKGQILAGAFQGMELQCARCHDSPYHSTTQRDLYSLAAMLARKPLTVPASSRVPSAFFENQLRHSLIQVTLKPGEPVSPVWPFAEQTGSVDDASLRELLREPDDTREKLAALITSPRNQRFAEVIVNRVWRRLIGSGLVDSPDDWEGKTASHPDLLKWLARDFVAHGYDLKHLSRQILTSQLYQRQARTSPAPGSAELQFFVAPERRRMSAEQLVDSLLVAVGKPMDVEEMTFAPEGGTRSEYRQTLGVPDRAWKFTSLGNERDRPSLSLPRARALADILEAFGWDGARQSPRTDREVDPNVLQAGVLQNSDASVLLTRVTEGSGLSEIALQAGTPEELVDQLYWSILNRPPRNEERTLLASLLAEGFPLRLLPESEWKLPEPVEPLPVVTWSNHVQPEANSIAVLMEQRARGGPPADPRFRPEWREAYEDASWSLLNLSEFVWIP